MICRILTVIYTYYKFKSVYKGPVVVAVWEIPDKNIWGKGLSLRKYCQLVIPGKTAAGWMGGDAPHRGRKWGERC